MNNKVNENNSAQTAKSHNASSKYKPFGSEDDYKFYYNYMSSDKWKCKRVERLAMDGNRCRNCGSKFHLQVHHLRYDSFGDEDLGDLRTLCNDCHKKVTNKGRRRRDGVITEFQ